MCKQLIIINPWQQLTDQVVTGIKDIVCSNGNKDGFGLATMDMGDIAHIKYVKPQGKVTRKIQATQLLEYVYGGGGNLPSMASKVLMAHGRYSTNKIDLPETHPILNEDKSVCLVHNGVVRTTEVYDTVTANDSEFILRAYERGGIQEVITNISGYYAFGLIDQINDTIHIVRDDKATLYVTQVHETSSIIFSTTLEDIHLLMKSPAGKLRKRKLTYDLPVLMKDNTVIEFELSTGRLLDSFEFIKKVDKYDHYSKYSTCDNELDHVSPDYNMDNVLNYVRNKV